MKKKKLLLFHAIAPERHQSNVDWANFVREASFLIPPEWGRACGAERLAPTGRRADFFASFAARTEARHRDTDSSICSRVRLAASLASSMSDPPHHGQ
jgi:hypothetical protein